MFFVYILQSKKNKSFYVGSCKNIEHRFKLHNKGLVKSTKRYAPWILVYKENFYSLKDARKRELQIKSWKKRNRIEKLIKFRFYRESSTKSELDNSGGPVVQR